MYFYYSELKTGLDMIYMISFVNQQVGTQEENQIGHREEKGITRAFSARPSCSVSQIYHSATDAQA